MTASSTPARASARGYTLVELMMALAILAVSVVGIISLHKVTVVTNGHAKNLAMAQRIAQAWAGQLQMDSTQWVTTIPSGSFLNALDTWQRPQYNVARGFGAAFDGLGAPLPDTGAANARFCTHVRMTSLNGPTMSMSGNGMLRAEIRVFWLREGAVPAGANPAAGLCPSGQDDATALQVGQATSSYHFVYQTVGLRQHYQI